MNKYKNYVVRNNNNVFYTGSDGKQVYDIRIMNKVVTIDPTQPFSDNLEEVIVPLDNVKNNEIISLWAYLKLNPSMFVIWPFTLTFGIISYIQGIPVVTGLMTATFLVGTIGTYISWKKLNK